MGLRERAQGQVTSCVSYRLERALLAVGPLIWPNLAKLLSKQPFGKSVHPDVTFQEPLSLSLTLTPTLPLPAGP